MTDTAAETSQASAAETPAETAAEATRALLIGDMQELTGAYHAFAAKVEHVASRAGRTLHLDAAVAAAEKAFTAISLHVHEVTSTGAEPEQPQLALAAPEAEAKPS